MDKRKMNNMLEKAKKHKKEILIGAGAIGCAAFGFHLGNKHVPKNVVKFSMSDKDGIKAYRKFFRANGVVRGAKIGTNLSKAEVKNVFIDAMTDASDECLYGIILEQYPKK